MAHIFNIYFTYQNITYNAMVSVRQTPFYTEYILNNFDENLAEELPGNKVISRSKEDLFFENTLPGSGSELMKSIIAALSNHLETIRV